METKFTVRGKLVTPAYFTVFFLKGGKTIKKAGTVESAHDMTYVVEGAIKCEVYKNGTHSAPATMIDQFSRA